MAKNKNTGNRYARMSPNRDMIGAGKKETQKEILDRGPQIGWQQIITEKQKVEKTPAEAMQARKQARDQRKEKEGLNPTKDNDKSKKAPEKDI